MMNERKNMLLSEKTQKFLAALLIAALILIAVKNIADSDVSKPSFTDVPATHWAFEGVQYCWEHGLMNGVGDGVFAPDEEVSTAQLAAVLVRMRWAAETESVDPSTTLDTWWSPYLFVAYRHGLLADTWIGNDQAAGKTLAWRSWRVEQAITRYEMALMLYNYMVVTGTGLPGVDSLGKTAQRIGDFSGIPQDYRVAVLTCVELGLITGTNAEGAFSGTSHMTRAQMAVILERMQKAQDSIDSGTDVAPASDAIIGYKEPSPSDTVLPAPVVPAAKPAADAAGKQFPTTGSTSAPNANGYYTEANVDYGSAVLVYELLELTNASRAAEGKPPLQWVPYDEAEEYTLLRAYECSYAYGHTRPCGESETSVAVANIGSASSYTLPSSIHGDWMASPGHRKTILGDYKYMCAAHCGPGWVVTFWNDYHFQNMEDYETAAHNYHVKCAQGVFPP